MPATETRPAYEQRIREHVTPEERAGHHNLLGLLMPIRDAISELQRNGVQMMAFDAEERSLLEQARRLLDRKCVPMPLVARPEEEPSPYFF